MACSCASGASDCMVKPGVADLNCGTDCCDPGVATLESIDPAIKEWYDDGQEDPPQGTAEERAILDRYAAAIAVSFAKIASSVCLGRYVADCVLVASFCVEASRSSCSCQTCTVCYDESINLDELGEYMSPDRIHSATVDGVDISVNGDDSDAAILLSTGVGWRLLGASEGTHEIRIQTNGAKPEFIEAVKSLACFRVPGPHASDCGTEDAAARVSMAAQLRQFDLIGDKFADDLKTDCACGSGVTLGRQSPVQWVRWDGGSAPEPTGSLSVGAHFDFASTAAFADGQQPAWNAAAGEFQPTTPGSGSDKNAEFDFINLAVWSAVHNFGKRPSVETVDVTGIEIRGVVDHVSVNQVDVTHATPRSGTIILN